MFKDTSLFVTQLPDNIKEEVEYALESLTHTTKGPLAIGDLKKGPHQNDWKLIFDDESSSFTIVADNGSLYKLINKPASHIVTQVLFCFDNKAMLYWGYCYFDDISKLYCVNVYFTNKTKTTLLATVPNAGSAMLGFDLPQSNGEVVINPSAVLFYLDINTSDLYSCFSDDNFTAKRKIGSVNPEEQLSYSYRKNNHLHLVTKLRTGYTIYKQLLGVDGTPILDAKGIPLWVSMVRTP